MRGDKLKKLIYAALFAALTYAATNLLRIPSPVTGGYKNLGDGMVLLGGLLLGPVYGAAAGGIGSMLGDLLLGYLYYVPGTFVIKAAMALCMALLYRRLRTRMPQTLACVLSGIAAECVMVAGYFCYSCFALGVGVAALASVPGNLAQGVVGVVFSTALCQVVARVPALRREFPSL